MYVDMDITHHLTMRIIKASVEVKLCNGLEMEANVASVEMLTMGIGNMKLLGVNLEYLNRILFSFHNSEVSHLCTK